MKVSKNIMACFKGSNAFDTEKTEIPASDLNIFKSKQDALPSDECSDISQCVAIKRLMIALRYYSLLNIEENEQNMDILMEFVNEVYGIQLLDDNNHLILAHKDKLYEIKQEFIGKDNVCSMKKCKFTQRHYVWNFVNLNFYCQVFDSLHFYLFHCLDGGFRVPLVDENKEEKDEEDKVMFVDAEFARIAEVIRKTDLLTEPFERISTGDNGKFNLNVDADEDNGDTTAMDELFAHMTADQNVCNDKVEKIKKFVKTERFDSDSLLNEDGMAHVELEKRCAQSIRRFMQWIDS